MSDEQEWPVAIPGFDGYFADRNGKIWKGTKDWVRLASEYATPRGYTKTPVVVNGVKRSVFTHRLVLLAFAGPRPDGHEACHDPDPTPSNNRPDNLRWATHHENMLDRGRHGRTALHQGVENGRAKLDADKVREIRQRLSVGESYSSIARHFGVNPTAIGFISRGVTWKHVPQEV